MARATSARGASLVQSRFETSEGAAFPGILDPLGRVFHPHPYNIPQWPWQILHFSLQMIQAMIDTCQITSKAFTNEQELFDFQRMVRDLVTFVHMKEHIREQPPPDMDDGPWVLYELKSILEHGEIFPYENVTRIFEDIDADHSQPPKIPRGKRLVAVVTISPLQIKKWTVAFDVSERTGFHMLANLSPCGNYTPSLYLVDADKLIPLRARVPPPFV